MKFKATFYDSINSKIIELADVEKDKIREVFESIPWAFHIERMKATKESEVPVSPSFEIENLNSRYGLRISAIGEKEWHIFFRRPKLLKLFFGLSDYKTTHKKGQTIKDVIECLIALSEDDLKFLENKLK